MRTKTGPSKNKFIQQTFPVFQLVFTTKCILITFILMALVCFCIGGPIYLMAAGIQEFQMTYSIPGNTATCPDVGDLPCLVRFELPSRIPGPVYLYYTLTGFYQNHRRYVSSRSDAMNRGDFGEDQSISSSFFRNASAPDSTSSSCFGFESYVAGGKTIVYYPCGLVARSIFNDTFALYRGTDGVEVNLTTDGIAWPISDSRKFASKDVTWLKRNCYRFGSLSQLSSDYNFTGFPESLRNFNGTHNASRSRYDCWHSLDSPELKVWMRTAATKNFWKLNRICNSDLEAGPYEMLITLRFPTAGFGGRKGFVLTNANPSGAKQNSLALLFLALGGILVILAIGFGTLSLFGPEPKKPVVRLPDSVIVEGQSSFSAAAFSSASKSAATTSDDSEQRIVQFPNIEDEFRSEFASNFVSTTKYTIFTFVPLNLMLQFQRFANVYFLVVAILASIPAISPIGSTTFWLPLALVLSISGAKDALEDYRRYQSDIEENSRITEMWSSEFCEFERVCWAEVTTGSLIRVRSTDEEISPMIPCDLALLATSSLDGTCFLETVNLDGETNLKQRQAPEQTQKDLTVMISKGGRESKESDAAKVLEVKLEALATLRVTVSCSRPDPFLYDFNARMKIGENEETEIALSGGSSGGQFLQRSTKLKNTTWCMGVAVYTGVESKIQMNMSDPKNKVSHLEKQLNRFIISIFCFLFLLCCAGAAGSTIFMSTQALQQAWYLAPWLTSATFNVTSPNLSGILSFFSFLILLSLLIPISLYVSVEFVKGFIAVIISSDRMMYVEDDDLPSKARSAGLCEELGQVTYIFSDKTGTLTQNLMVFKKCSIAGMEFGRGYCEVERAIARRRGLTLPPDPAPPEGVDPDFQFVDERLLFCKWMELPERDIIEQFLKNLALNHTVQVEVDNLRATLPNFQAESPDEGAFVSAARNLGFFFCKRFMKEITLKISSCDVGDGQEKSYYILNFNAFDNDRKRSSVVVRDSDGTLSLLVKGADTSVMPFIDRTSSPFLELTQSHINAFGEQGLRTLVFAGRSLTDDEYEAWNIEYQAASLLNEGRDDALRQLASKIEENHLDSGCPSALFDASTSYECKLQLHGVTALEDKLQEDVGHCISQLAKALIKIWVLTGDKLETAINIGFATALLSTEMEPLLRISQDEINNPEEGWQKTASALELKLHGLIQLVADMEIDRLLVQLGKAQTYLGEEEELFKNMVQNIRDVWENADAIAAGAPQRGTSLRKKASMKGEKTKSAKEKLKGMLASVDSKLKDALMRERVRAAIVRMDQRTRKKRLGGYALVVDGPCLRAALHPTIKLVFLAVAVRCKAVICCRVTPSQKAQVTLLVKDNIQGQITLAIGDGANDVSMIQAAHIGVGIRGKEGQQAVLAADYALPRFAFLERLLLVHGHYSYNRISTMMCYFFYKNIVFALTLFWFGLLNAFSAQPLYDDGYQALYNLVFTSMPVMTFAVFERDMEPYMLCARPELYSTGQKSKYFNSERFATFIIGAIAHSMMIFFAFFLCLDLNISNQTGRGYGIWSVGTAVLTNIIIVVTVVMGLNTRSWSWIHWMVYIGSVVVWVVFILVYHAMDPGFWGHFDTSDNVYFIVYELVSMLMFWMVQLILTLSCVVPIIAYKYFREHYDPGVDDYYRRVIQKPKRYPADAHLVPKKSKEVAQSDNPDEQNSPSRTADDNMRSPSWTIMEANEGDGADGRGGHL